MNLKSLGLIGAAFGFGQKQLGVEAGPAALRNHGLLDYLQGSGRAVIDWGDLVEEPLLSQGQHLRILHDATLEIAKKSPMNLVLGGDHSIALGSLSALLKVHPDLAVIWVDAHGDMNTPLTSPSGNLHGMPLAGLLGFFHASEWKDLDWLAPCLETNKLALVGVRDLDQGEIDFIKEFNIKAVTSEEVLDRGMKAVMHEVLQAVDPLKCSPLHLSFDIDCMDPSEASATGLHVPNVLKTEHIKELGQALAATGRLVSAEFVEVNPMMARSESELNQSVHIIIQLILELLRDTSRSQVYECTQP